MGCDSGKVPKAKPFELLLQRSISYLHRGSVQKLQRNTFNAKLIFSHCITAKWETIHNFFYCALLSICVHLNHVTFNYHSHGSMELPTNE